MAEGTELRTVSGVTVREEKGRWLGGTGNFDAKIKEILFLVFFYYTLRNEIISENEIMWSGA